MAKLSSPRKWLLLLLPLGFFPWIYGILNLSNTTTNLSYILGVQSCGKWNRPMAPFGGKPVKNPHFHENEQINPFSDVIIQRQRCITPPDLHTWKDKTVPSTFQIVGDRERGFLRISNATTSAESLNGGFNFCYGLSVVIHSSGKKISGHLVQQNPFNIAQTKKDMAKTCICSIPIWTGGKVATVGTIGGGQGRSEQAIKWGVICCCSFIYKRVWTGTSRDKRHHKTEEKLRNDLLCTDSNMR